MRSQSHLNSLWVQNRGSLKIRPQVSFGEVLKEAIKWLVKERCFRTDISNSWKELKCRMAAIEHSAMLNSFQAHTKGSSFIY